MFLPVLYSFFSMALMLIVASASVIEGVLTKVPNRATWSLVDKEYQQKKYEIKKYDQLF